MPEQKTQILTDEAKKKQTDPIYLCIDEDSEIQNHMSDRDATNYLDKC